MATKTKSIRRTIPTKDHWGNKLHVGDKVTFVYKAYGYRKIENAYLCEGVVEKLPEEEFYSYDFNGQKEEGWRALYDGNVAVNCGCSIKWVPAKNIILHK